MIFVTLGSQKFQFNRLLKEIDRLIEKGIIKEKVFAQIGVSDYKPQNYQFEDFLTQDEFKKNMDEASFVITHAGTGAIITALKKDKKVIAIPRLAKYCEHVDDHQVQLINEFNELNFIEPVYEVEELERAVKKINNSHYSKYVSNTEVIINDLKEYIG